MSEKSEYGDKDGEGDMDCAGFADVAAELALGVLTGRERAAALAHLDGCPACRAYVGELTTTGEELLALLPSREPPAGFEMRVIDRLGLAVSAAAGVDPAIPSGSEPAVPGSAVSGSAVSGSAVSGSAVSGSARFGRIETALLADEPGATGRHVVDRRPRGIRPRDRYARRRWSRALAAAVIVGALAGAGAAGWGLRAATSTPVAASPLSSAALLTAAHQTVGEVYLDNRAPQWMYASVAMDGLGNTTVICQIVSSNGRVTTVGTVHLSGGYGSWGGPAWSISGQIAGARLITPSGTVLATATF